ncbi:unnamed protein product [Gordionus sp. m RMFG-2023]
MSAPKLDNIQEELSAVLKRDQYKNLAEYIKNIRNDQALNKYEDENKYSYDVPNLSSSQNLGAFNFKRKLKKFKYKSDINLDSSFVDNNQNQKLSTRLKSNCN